MTSSSATTPANLSKFQGLLRKLFQFDCADLDFGIYRIMNHKRDAVERFVNEQLPAAIAAELDGGQLAQQAQAREKLAEIGLRIKSNVDDNAIDDKGNLKSKYHNLRVGKEYLEAQRQVVDGSRSRDAVEAAIYNHLYTFFSRYYEDGDFISKRRYSRNQRYAIPYNGEEVYLHWANSDQYYVKSDEYFRNYAWKAPNGVAVHFRLKNADVDQNNVKSGGRFFVPRVAETELNAGSNAVTIPFDYRPLSDSEKTTYNESDKQEAIFRAAVSAISKKFNGNAQSIAPLMDKHRLNGNDPVSHLEHHMHQYVRRNNSDFFIHKDLSGFLNRELDIHLKNDVMNLDNMANAGLEVSEGWFQEMRLTKAVGSQIIAFLAQIEGFQKMLWEKLKFVTEAQYCITLGNIPDDIYPDIVANEAQWEEWQELYGIDISDRSPTILQTYPTLVLDTQHFDADFTDRLLASFDDLDGATSGLLIHSENWQALRLLSEKYRGTVRCTYIDPPFNTGADGFLYKDRYQHSSWLTMMESRIQASIELLASDGTFYAHIDYSEKENLKLMLDKYLYYITEIIWRIGWVSGYKSVASKFIRNHDTIYHYGKTDSPLFIKTYIPYSEEYKRREGSSSSGQGYPLEDTWNCSEKDKLHSIQIMSFSKEKVGNQALTQKNENLVARMLKSSSQPNDVVLDYFLGSGTTTAVAHKMDRQYIGIEMGQQFFKYALPRMKRVLYGDSVGISSDVEWEGGGIFKYIRIESYEDSLDSIQFDCAVGNLGLAEKDDDDLLKYMLKWETKGSETLLNAAKLARPFSYRLQVHVNGEQQERTVDLGETFNFLLGLNVGKREVYTDNGQRYLIYRGETRAEPGRKVVVIWRDTGGWTEDDFARDRDFVARHNLSEGADTVFVNGDSAIPGAKPIEPILKARMFASVNDQ